MVPPDPPIFLLNFRQKVFVEIQVIDESGSENRKNPSEDMDLFTAYLVNTQAFELRCRPDSNFKPR